MAPRGSEKRLSPLGSRNRLAGPVGWLILVSVLFLFGEALSFLTGELWLIPGANFLFYRMPQEDSLSEKGFQEYLSERDNLLGWPSPGGFGGKRRDPSGSRWIPAFPESGREAVSVYGDSYAYGSDVSHEKAWSNVLSLKLDARVANYGVGGYGTDQAFLRFRENHADRAKIVILTIFPDNLKRNVNQHRYFLAPGKESVFGLKPRFALSGQELKLVRIPDLTYGELEHSFRRPEIYFTHEFFTPGSSSGPVTWNFPYSLSVLRALNSPQVRSRLSGAPGWRDFFLEGHASEALSTTAAIIQAFDGLAEERGKHALTVVFPSKTSLEAFRESGRLYSRPLLERLEESNITAIDLTESFSTYLMTRNYEELQVQKSVGHRHYNQEGNRLVADLLHRLLLERDLVNLSVRRRIP